VVTRHLGSGVVTRVAARGTLPIALAADRSSPPGTGTATTTTDAAPAVATSMVHRLAVNMVRATTTTTTTTTQPPPPASEVMGVASWYYQARFGMCASPYLSFGTVVTVTDQFTGRSIRCTVDDRQARNPGRVVDLSYDGFAELARPSTGLVEVRLTW
jgi:rare lipoprotein A (peptidoglycan hydrolase)